MQTTDELQHQFAIPGALTFSETPSGLALATIATSQAEATIYLQGAHLAAWTPAGQRPAIFLSSKSEFTKGKAIRGGVPIVFPWFGARSDGRSGPSHGFARTLPWAVESVALLDNGSVTIALLLTPSDVTRGLGYDVFQLRYRLTVGRSLRLELEVRNESREALTIEEALHSYFSISDIHSASVTGLEGTAYLDKVSGGQRKIQSAEPIRFTGETDRVYLDTTATCTIHDFSNHRRIVIEKTGSRSTVVWNPWIEKARALADLGDDEWQEMVCVETGNAAEDAVVVGPGATHAMTATVRVEPASKP